MNGLVRIYLDYNATTPLVPGGRRGRGARARATTSATRRRVHAFGQRAKAALDDARGAGRGAHRRRRRAKSSSRAAAPRPTTSRCAAPPRRSSPPAAGTSIASGIEHEAVLNTLKALERRGWTVDAAAGRRDAASSSPEALARRITADTALVSVMHANNEIGTIQPIAELAALAHEHGALFHTDAVQSVGKIPGVGPRARRRPAVARPAHKFGGPKGAGALWIRRGVRLDAVHDRRHAGAQPARRARRTCRRIAGLGVAARLARETARRRARAHRRRCAIGSSAASSRACRARASTATRRARVPNTTNISFDGVEAESLLIALDLEGIAVSTGSACSSGSLEPSHVLRAMGLPHARTRNSLRFSLGPATTADGDRLRRRRPARVSSTSCARLTRTAAALR